MAMRELSDQDLVEEAKAGSDAAFAALYARQTVHAARRNLHKRRVGREHGWLGFALPGLAVAWLGGVTANLSGIGKAALVAGVLAVGGGAATALEGGASGGLLGGAVLPAAAATPTPAYALAGLPRHLVAATSTPRTQSAPAGQSAAARQSPMPKQTATAASTATQTVAAEQSPAPRPATPQTRAQHTSRASKQGTAPKQSTVSTQTAWPTESGRSAPPTTARPAGPAAQVARDCNTGGGQPSQGAPQQDPQVPPAPQQ